MNTAISENWSGVALCALLAVPAWLFGTAYPMIGGPVAGIILGMLIALFRRPARLDPGIRYTGKKILQYAVILLGFGMNFFEVLKVGSDSLWIILCTITAALVMAWIGSKLLHMHDKSACLIGVGTCICGGSAIAAAAPCIEASDEDVARSISTIFFFNIIAAFVFPPLGRWLGMTDSGFGLFAGTAVNDTSSVVAAATTWCAQAGNDVALTLATIVKLTRTLAIIPICVGLSVYMARKKAGESANKVRITKIFPLFVLFFVIAAVINTAAPLGSISAWLTMAGKFMITMAMFAIGCNTNIAKLVRSGSRGLALGLLCWIAVAGVSIWVQHLNGQW